MKRPKGRVGFVRISMWRSSGVEAKLLGWLKNSLVMISHILLVSFHAVRQIVEQILLYPALLLAMSWDTYSPWKTAGEFWGSKLAVASCAATMLFTLVWSTHHCFSFSSISPLHLMWQTDQQPCLLVKKTIAIISIQFLFQVCGYNSWRLEQVTVGESLELKTAWPSALGTSALQQQNVSAFCIRAVWTVRIKPFFPSDS